MANLRKAAKGRHCTARLLGCNPGPDNETVVGAHAPCVDKALALKAPDWWMAWLCASCHYTLGEGNPTDMMWKDYWETWFRAVYETQSELHKSGLLGTKET